MHSLFFSYIGIDALSEFQRRFIDSLSAAMMQSLNTCNPTNVFGVQHQQPLRCERVAGCLGAPFRKSYYVASLADYVPAVNFKGRSHFVAPAGCRAHVRLASPASRITDHVSVYLLRYYFDNCDPL
jgi:hypothetical protein